MLSRVIRASRCPGGADDADGDTWYQLVNATTGIANLQHVFGTGVLDEIRD